MLCLCFLNSAYNMGRKSLLSNICRMCFHKAEAILVNDAGSMSKGQVTIPKNAWTALGIETGDRVTFIAEGVNVRVMNSAVYAMMRFQEQMKGEADRVGMLTEEDVEERITQSRRPAFDICTHKCPAC